MQKRMGTLHNLVAKQRPWTCLGGKGRLTADLISTKTHKGEAEATQKAVMATMHITSNDDVANTTLCPPGQIPGASKTLQWPRVSRFQNILESVLLMCVRLYLSYMNVSQTRSCFNVASVGKCKITRKACIQWSGHWHQKTGTLCSRWRLLCQRQYESSMQAKEGPQGA